MFSDVFAVVWAVMFSVSASGLITERIFGKTRPKSENLKSSVHLFFCVFFSLVLISIFLQTGTDLWRKFLIALITALSWFMAKTATSQFQSICKNGDFHSGFRMFLFVLCLVPPLFMLWAHKDSGYHPYRLHDLTDAAVLAILISAPWYLIRKFVRKITSLLRP